MSTGWCSRAILNGLMSATWISSHRLSPAPFSRSASYTRIAGQALKPGEGIEWGKPQMKRAGPGVESILRGQMLLRRMDVAQAALQG